MSPESPKACDAFGEIELVTAFHALKKLRDSIEIKVSDEHIPIDPTVELDGDQLALLDGFLERKDWVIKKSEKSKPSLFTDSASLNDNQITEGPSLCAKDDMDQRISDAITAPAGTDHSMSSDTFNKFLDMFLNLVAISSEASARTWVETFLQRASALLPSTKEIVLDVQPNVSPASLTAVSDYGVRLINTMNYSVIVTNDPSRTVYFEDRLNCRRTWELQEDETVLGLFLIKAEDTVDLYDHVTHVARKLYTAAKKMKKSHMRGTLTTGYDWVFIILHVDPSCDGFSYRTSDHAFSVWPQDSTRTGWAVPQRTPDLVSAILASWIEHSSEGLLDDDLFQ